MENFGWFFLCVDDIKHLQNSIGLQEDCSCGIAEILESRSQRLSQNKGSKKRDAKNFHAGNLLPDVLSFNFD